MASSFTELEARIEALEARKLALRDLPLASLQRKLENDWNPSAALLAPGSVTAELLGLTVQTQTTAALAAGVEGSVSQAHGLGKIPAGVIAWLEDGTWASQCSFRVERDVLNVAFYVFNHGPAAATAVVNFIVLP